MGKTITGRIIHVSFSLYIFFIRNMQLLRSCQHFLTTSLTQLESTYNHLKTLSKLKQFRCELVVQAILNNLPASLQTTVGLFFLIQEQGILYYSQCTCSSSLHHAVLSGNLEVS